MRPVTLIGGYISIVLLPLGLAWLGARPPRSFMNELATGTGILAFVIILVEFVLSGRFRAISGKVGLDVTMLYHQLLARTALVLALVHPFLYRGDFNYQRPWDPTRQLTLANDFDSLATGLIAWIALIVFVVISVARDQLPYRYETWRLMHGLGAILIAGFGLHHTLHAGRYSQDPVLAGVWLTLFGVAIVSLVFVYVVRPILQRNRAWRVVSVEQRALKIWELTLKPENHYGLDFEAGQFAWLNVGNGSFSLHENPFSISSAPSDKDSIQFLIKELGDFSGSVGRIVPGTKAYVDGPHGNLTVAGREEPGIALIAGGVGVAPLLSILRQLRLEGDKRPSVLVYANRIEQQIVHREELEALATDHGTRVVHVLSEPPQGWDGLVGLVDPKMLGTLFQPAGSKNWLYILCGPVAMMETVESALLEMGVPQHNIVSERFDYD